MRGGNREKNLYCQWQYAWWRIRCRNHKIWTLYLPDMMRTALNAMEHLSGDELLQGLLGL